MGAKSHVSRWGTSLAVRIPKSIAEQWGVQEGSVIEIEPDGDQIVLRKRNYDLADMLAQVTPENLHPEENWGAGPRSRRMVDQDYVPARGDIVWLTFSPQAGHEQAGRRPALVLSPKTYNERTGLALFCPITSVVKGYPFEVPLPSTSAISGVVLADQVRSLDWRARRAGFEGRAERQVITDALEKISLLLE